MLNFVARASYKTKISGLEDRSSASDTIDTIFIFHLNGGCAQLQIVKLEDSRLGKVNCYVIRIVWKLLL